MQLLAAINRGVVDRGLCLLPFPGMSTNYPSLAWVWFQLPPSSPLPRQCRGQRGGEWYLALGAPHGLVPGCQGQQGVFLGLAFQTCPRS